jgi:hypothetical protein
MEFECRNVPSQQRQQQARCYRYSFSLMRLPPSHPFGKRSEDASHHEDPRHAEPNAVECPPEEDEEFRYRTIVGPPDVGSLGLVYRAPATTREFVISRFRDTSRSDERYARFRSKCSLETRLGIIRGEGFASAVASITLERVNVRKYGLVSSADKGN